MKLKKLLKDIPVRDIKGSKEIEVTGVCANSKLVAPGNLFVAKRGRTVDGALFIPEAISGGAVAVLTDIYDPTLKNVTQIIHPDISEIEGEIAGQYNQFPSEELFMVAVTGTSGKTTSSYQIKHLLDKTNGPCGLIGTIEYISGKHHYQATHTTPDVSTNHKMLKEMVHHGCRSAVMEVTSHALDQGRVQNIHFDVAIFTNLTPEHLDYHDSMENYCNTKNLLFRSLDPKKKKKGYTKVAIVNADDPYSSEVLRGCRTSVLTFGIEREADIRASEIKLTPKGTKYLLHYQGKPYSMRVPLIGRFNVYNSLAALACGISQGIPMDTLTEAAKTFPSAPGRLELVPNDLGLKIYVDFAHKPDALENVLRCINEIKKGRIITIFGCGGDRDRLKRPVMAEVCEALSDVCIVTSDNPRTEDPQAIICDIMKGFKKPKNCIVESDRRTAIERAIEMASSEDNILIAGKGHEPYQIFSHHTVEFDDRKVTTEVCRNIKKQGV